ncbi:hypothetical protein EVAR_21477_1 [Eumeta japonica]|uniref:Uncharacterized protein n=1 Tax=Eumeta variegata TaxID=151549 RepID=A0A4C1ZLH2_EUMVA|nr:hypothetical protein EVAR_21477_1 [Eumeta japonica]
MPLFCFPAVTPRSAPPPLHVSAHERTLIYHCAGHSCAFCSDPGSISTFARNCASMNMRRILFSFAPIANSYLRGGIEISIVPIDWTVIGVAIDGVTFHFISTWKMKGIHSVSTRARPRAKPAARPLNKKLRFLHGATKERTLHLDFAFDFDSRRRGAGGAPPFSGRSRGPARGARGGRGPRRERRRAA